MGQCVEPEPRELFLVIFIEEAARIAGACVGDDEPDIEIGNSALQRSHRALLRQINDGRARLDAELASQLFPQAVEERFAPGSEYHIEAYRGED